MAESSFPAKRRKLPDTINKETMSRYAAAVEQDIAQEYEAKAKTMASLSRNKIRTGLLSDLPQAVIAGSTQTWSDLQPGKLACFELKKYSPEKLYTIAVNTFEEMHTRLTTQTVAKLLMLAYNLRDRGGQELFGPTEPELDDEAQRVNLEELDNDRVLPRGGKVSVCPIIYNGDLNTAIARACTANALCFLAASFLRLFTKPSENFIKIGERLQQTFRSFFPYTLPVSRYIPPISVVESIRTCFSRNSIIKNTFYVLLYSGEVTEVGMDLKDFLYKIHISNAGMHAYRLFMQCTEVYSVDNDDLAEYFHSEIIEAEMESLCKFVRNCVVPDSGGNQLEMWKYAAIFDGSFFVELQTKNCPTFRAILAYLLKAGLGEGNGQDLLKIAHISSLPREAKEFASAYAMKVRSEIQRHLYTGNYEYLQYFV